MSSHSSNPFATRFVSPGQIDWAGEEDFLEQLALRWQALKFRASIVGVHGSGKSTLLEHFVPLIGDVVWRRDAEGQKTATTISRDINQENCRPTVWLQLRKAVPLSMSIPWKELVRGRLLIVDGYEQLSLWRRAMLVARTGLQGVALLVTSHRRTMLPTLCELSITASTARQIVSQLMAGQGDLATISDEEIQRCLHSHGGNMREVLMDLYDRVEDRRAVRSVEV